MRSIFWIVIFFCLSANVFSDELISVDALNGKIHILAPKGFGPMPQDILAVKYPATQRPTEVLSNDTGSVTLAFNHTNNLMAPSQVREAHAAVSQMFHNMYPSAQWLRDEVIEQNGHTFMVLEVVTPAIDTQIHNIIYGTSVDGRFLIAAFNTTVEQSGEWLPIGRNIMNSIDVD